VQSAGMRECPGHARSAAEARDGDRAIVAVDDLRGDARPPEREGDEVMSGKSGGQSAPIRQGVVMG